MQNAMTNFLDAGGPQRQERGFIEADDDPAEDAVVEHEVAKPSGSVIQPLVDKP